jgi:amino acid transporter
MTRLASEITEQLPRQLTGLAIWLLIINLFVGAGIFGVPAEAARLTGVFSPLVFLLCGLLMAPVMLSFAEVASHFRNTGGPILYARTAFGPLVGFETGWALYVARVTAFAANINLLVSALGFFWSGANQGVGRLVLLFLVCGAFTAVTAVSTRGAVGSVGGFTVLKFLPLVGLVVLGITRLPESITTLRLGATPAYSDIGAAALLLVYAYAGFESALIPAGEAKHPTRDMPRALLWALGTVTVLYVLVQTVAVIVVPNLAASERPLVDAAAALVGPVGALVMTGGVIVSIGGNIAAGLLAASRITYAMAIEGNLPAWFAAVHPRYHTPVRSLLVFSGSVFLLSVWGSFAWLAGISSVTRLLVYVLSVGTIPFLRKRDSERERWRLPGGLAIPVLAVAVCGWLLVQVRAGAFLVTAGFLVAGLGLYLVARGAEHGRGRSRTE